MATETKLGASPPGSMDTQGTEEVPNAVALGWQMAELYWDAKDRDQKAKTAAKEKAEARAEAAGAGGALAGAAAPVAGTAVPTAVAEPGLNDLPGVGKLREQEKQQLGLAQLVHGLAFLASATGDKEVERLHGQVHEDVEKGNMPSDPRRLHMKLRALHVELLTALTVADFRLGKAYSLGRALREGTRAGQEVIDLEHHLGSKHLAKLIAWCADLKSALPDHAGQAVADSLRRWQSWGRQRPWATSIGRAEFDSRLDRQGERWRSILTGEKKARDLLTVGTYIGAGEELIADASNLAVGFMRRFWLPVLLAIALVAVGLVVILVGGSEVGGIASILTGLGISWKTATPTLSKVGEQLSGPLWQAELDRAITIAVTDAMVPDTSAAPPSADQPVPVKRATDARTTRKAARQVWKRIDRATKTRALTGRDPLRRLGYRFSGLWRGGEKAPFIPRDPFLGHVQSAVEARLASKDVESGASTRDELFAEFGPDDWEWVRTVVEGGLTALEGKHDFGLKPAEEAMKDKARIVLFGDWGTGTPRAQALSEQIQEQLKSEQSQDRLKVRGDFELHMIHLGDVYYCGEPDEYQRRFLRFWPARDRLANAKSWNLNGNHDMYSGGRGYFELVGGTPGLPAGEPVPDNRLDPSAFKQQKGTSFFRIANERWQIIGLDSAYVDNDLDARQKPWLNKWLGLEQDEGDEPPPRPSKLPALTRKTILLSHHQLGSSRDQAGVGPGIRGKTKKALEKNLIHAWFWGHEHRAFVYKPYLNVPFPVCVGNGGVPELRSHVFTFVGAFQFCVGLVRKVLASLTLKRFSARAPKVKFKQKTPRVDRQGLKWEKLGFVVVELDGDEATAVYHDEDGKTYELESFGS
jgi:3',5'-cyclic AMP phosphodiesterase CpdA